MGSIRRRIRGPGQRLKRRRGQFERIPDVFHTESGTIEALRIGEEYQTTYGTLWKDGTYFPRGTEVTVSGLHLDQGFCVRFPARVGDEPLETWEDWAESDFLAAKGTIAGSVELSARVLNEARDVLREAEDGTHLHLHESDESA